MSGKLTQDVEILDTRLENLCEHLTKLVRKEISHFELGSVVGGFSVKLRITPSFKEKLGSGCYTSHVVYPSEY